MSKKRSKKPSVTPEGFFVYIGPSVRGLVQYGTVLPGTREDAEGSLAPAIEKHPEIKQLLVSGEELGSARIQVKTPGNLLYEVSRRMSAGINK